MSEPLRTEPTSGREVSHPADSAAQIERLLLSGLDLYFAGQYQEAINIWTRVVFLERGHGRARAYIERARTAIAEQHREADELFHQGRAAYERGSLDDARRLLTRAVDRGGSADDALLLLQQLNRFGGAGIRADVAPVPSPSASPRPRDDHGRGWVRAAGGVAVVSGLALFAAPLVSWFGNLPAAGGAPTTSGPVENLPIVRTGDVALTRARQLYVGGHLADALRTLEGIDVGDPVRSQAEKLRGDIQRDLLATVRQSTPTSAEGVPR
jgi:tetratricopeptide (TPR) repeat protein